MKVHFLKKIGGYWNLKLLLPFFRDSEGMFMGEEPFFLNGSAFYLFVHFTKNMNEVPRPNRKPKLKTITKPILIYP